MRIQKNMDQKKTRNSNTFYTALYLNLFLPLFAFANRSIWKMQIKKKKHFRRTDLLQNIMAYINRHENAAIKPKFTLKHFSDNKNKN